MGNVKDVVYGVGCLLFVIFMFALPIVTGYALYTIGYTLGKLDAYKNVLSYTSDVNVVGAVYNDTRSIFWVNDYFSKYIYIYVVEHRDTNCVIEAIDKSYNNYYSQMFFLYLSHYMVTLLLAVLIYHFMEDW